MKRIGILSDTHGLFDDKLKYFFKDVDELWHAGDIGSLELADSIAAFKPLLAVYGNIDDASVRVVYPETLRFYCEETDVLMLHITGYPGKYSPKAADMLAASAPKIFVGGHSHILKVMFDKKHDLLYINPGAAGIYGFHKVRTAVRFSISGSAVSGMEVGEWEK